MKNGQGWGLTILVGHKLGISDSYKEEATILAQGGTVTACKIGALEKEAVKVHNAVADGGQSLVNTANDILKSLLSTI